jgi:hypothetical protein
MIRKTIAATCLFAALALAAPASANGYRHGHWGGHGHYNSHNYYHHDGAIIAGGLLLGALIGHLAAPPRTVYVAPPPQPPLSNCRTIYGTGNVSGRLAEYSGTGCYDGSGSLHVMPGSERFLRYLD